MLPRLFLRGGHSKGRDRGDGELLVLLGHNDGDRRRVGLVSSYQVDVRLLQVVRISHCRWLGLVVVREVLVGLEGLQHVELGLFLFEDGLPPEVPVDLGDALIDLLRQLQVRYLELAGLFEGLDGSVDDLDLLDGDDVKLIFDVVLVVERPQEEGDVVSEKDK